MSPSHRLPTERQIARGLIAGSEGAVQDDTFRYCFYTLDEALAYVEDAGFDLVEQSEIYAVVATARRARLTPRRESFDQLSARTQKRYRGSRQFRAEAESVGLTVEQWYEFAPDLRAARGKAPGRKIEVPLEFCVWIERDYDKDAMSEKEKQDLSKSVREAWDRRREEQGRLFDE